MSAASSASRARVLEELLEEGVEEMALDLGSIWRGRKSKVSRSDMVGGCGRARAGAGGERRGVVAGRVGMGVVGWVAMREVADQENGWEESGGGGVMRALSTAVKCWVFHR